LLAVVDPVIRRVCREALDSAGFAVASGIESGAAAMTAAREQHPQIIVLSQQLSDVPALETVKWLRSNTESAATPIIILGGNADAKTARDRVTVLPRPITAAQLHYALVEALANRAPTQQVSP
jgi:DNA-binding response OmpR family regulator